MADDERKKYINKHRKKSWKKHMDVIRGYHADDEDAAKKREKAEDEIESLRVSGRDVVEDWFDHYRGSKTYKFDGKKREDEAEDLLNHVILEGIKHRDGKDAYKMFAKNVDMIRGYAKEVLGVNYEQFLQELQNPDRHGKNLESLIGELLDEVAAASAKENMDVSESQKELTRNPKYFVKNREYLEEVLGDYGMTPADHIANPRVVKHILAHEGGKINEDYKIQHTKKTKDLNYD